MTIFEVPATVTSIEESAFEDCRSLSEIEIPERVTSIGEFAFYECYSLKRLDIKNLEAWCNIMFEDETSNPIYYTNGFTLNGREVSRLKITDNITNIGDYAFINALNLITVDAGHANIMKKAFSSCKNLEKIMFNCDMIGSEAFYDSEAITDVYC